MTNMEQRTFLKKMQDPEYRNTLRAQLLEQLRQLDLLEEQLKQLENQDATI